jgi:hypothetical protein
VNDAVQSSIEPAGESSSPAQPGYDLRDWLTLILMGGGFTASWVYVFEHPSDTNFGICVGAIGTFGAVFHWLCVKDDKMPDRKDA